MEPDLLQETIAKALARECSRRVLMARALALGLSATTLTSLLAACGSARSSPAAGTPRPTARPPTRLPEIIPAPRAVTYGGLAAMGQLACCDWPSETLRDRLAEIADTAGITLGADTACEGPGSRLTVTLDATDLPPQGYRLAIVPSAHGADIRIQAVDEAGAFYGLQSFSQLVVAGDAVTFLRQATVADEPSFERRGIILDPPWLERLRFGVDYKLNFLAVASGMPPPPQPGVAELVDYCRTHHVELMSMVGYGNALTGVPTDDLKAVLSTQHQLGVRSFCLKWDDIHVDDPVALAATHGAIFNELYAHLRLLDGATRISIVMPPYGGVPDRNLFDGEAGAAYLALMRELLPADVVVFWTGDGGVFSQLVTTAGARAYRTLVGHPIGLWDNDAIRYANAYRPLAGRAADLSSVVSTYVANMNDHETAWKDSSGHFALLTELQYAWRAETYDAGAACASAEAVLRARGRWVAPGSSCPPAGASWSPEPIPMPTPMTVPSAAPPPIGRKAIDPRTRYTSGRSVGM